MIELVFNDSTAGAMKAAKNLGKSVGTASTMLLYDEEQKKEYSFTMDVIEDASKRLPGSSQEIVCVHLDADVGDICDVENRREVYKLLYEIYGDTNGVADDFYTNTKAAIRRLKEAIHTGEKIRVWWGNSADEVCGFHWAMELLENHPGTVTVVKAEGYYRQDEWMEAVKKKIEQESIPADVKEADFIHEISSTASLEAEQFVNWLESERDIPGWERKMYGSIWRAQKEKNAPLRVVINGTIMSVGEGFYDRFILEQIPEGEFSFGLLVGKVLDVLSMTINDGWIASRILYFIEMKKLEWIKKGDFLYEGVLRKL